MDSVRLLEEAIDAARRLGFQIREESLAGSGGGACRIRGQKCLFLDLGLAPRERLQQVLSAIRSDPDSGRLAVSLALARVLRLPKAA